MSSREALSPMTTVSPTRRLARSASIISCLMVGLLTLSGCGSGSGFQPLYSTAEGKTYDQRLATVEIATIPGRVGQRIRNELVFERSTGSEASPA